MSQFDKRNLSMMMDFYEMIMANGYFVNGGENTRVRRRRLRSLRGA